MSTNSCSHYFIIRKEIPEEVFPDLILSDDGVANVTTDDMDFSGRTFRILESPFQKSCYACAQMEPDQAPDVIRILRKAYPDITQLIFPKLRFGRKVVSDYGNVSEENKRAFWNFLKAKDIALERFILDEAYLVIIDGSDDILSDMIKNRLFDIGNVAVMENLNDPAFVEKYGNM